MNPGQTAWALLTARFQKKTVCRKCARLGLEFLGGAEALLQKANLPWPLRIMEALLKEISRNKVVSANKYPEKMRHDVALLLWQIPLSRRQGSLQEIIRNFRNLMTEAGVDEESFRGLVEHVWKTQRAQELANSEQQELPGEPSMSYRRSSSGLFSPMLQT